MKTVAELKAMIREVQETAYEACDNFDKANFPNNRFGPCGFAWVNIHKFNGKKLDGRSRIGKMLREAGIRKNDYEKVFQIWNPSGHLTQRVDSLEVGAEVAATVLSKYGFECEVCSRLD